MCMPSEGKLSLKSSLYRARAEHMSAEAAKTALKPPTGGRQREGHQQKLEVVSTSTHGLARESNVDARIFSWRSKTRSPNILLPSIVAGLTRLP